MSTLSIQQTATGMDARSSAQFDGVDLAALADRLGTPLHAYSASAIRQRINALQQALHGLDATICYAVKANGNRAILELMAAAGLGADIVSAGELRRALQAGIPPERIVFSGAGKTAAEIEFALKTGVPTALAMAASGTSSQWSSPPRSSKWFIADWRRDQAARPEGRSGRG